MKGIAKVIGTGHDLMYCLEYVQAAPEGERQKLAAELAAQIAAIEERGYICVPILETDTDRKTITIRAGAEIAEGTKIRGVAGCTVSEIGQSPAPQDDGGGMEPEVFLSAHLTKALPEGAGTVCFVSPIDPLAQLDITPESFAAVKEVLKSYE